MKKGAIFLMATFLFTVGPTVIHAHAQEIDKPNFTLDMVTKELSSLTENILDHSAKTDNNNIAKLNETNNANSNSILLREPQSSNEAGNSNQAENRTAESVPSLTADSQTVQETQVKSSTKQTENTITETVDNTTDSKANLLSGDLDLPAVGNVNVNLLSNGQNSTDALLGLEITNSAILGDINVDLLSNEQSSNGSGSKSLAKVNLNNELGQTHIGIIESTKVVTNDTIKTNSGLLITDIKDTIIGNFYLGVGQFNTIETPLYKEMNSWLINTYIDSPLLSTDQLGLVEFHQLQTDRSLFVTGGLVILDMQNSRLGDTHIGIGEFSNTVTKINPSVPGTDPVSTNQQNDIPIQPFNPNKDKGNKEGNQNVSMDSQSSTAIVERKSDSADEFIKNGTSAGSKTYLEHNIKSNNRMFVKNGNPITNNTGDDAIQLALSSASATTKGSSSESESGGPTSLGGGSGVNCLFDLSYQKELEIKNYVQFILQELTDKWIKAPPIKPPQAAFFLSI